VATSVPEDMPAISAEEIEARAALVLSLRRLGVRDRAVLSAVENVPRRLFLTAGHHRLAYEDRPLPIECGQTVSAPSLVARIVEALELSENRSVLEVGTGSGYLTAVMSHVAGRIDSLDRYRTLADLARQRIAALKLENVVVHHGDGLQGFVERAPYDRIIMTGAVQKVPETLFAQLSANGILIAPLGAPGELQNLVRFRKGDGGTDEEVLEQIRTVSLISGKAELL